jgi:fructosamine-3-kinase
MLQAVEMHREEQIRRWLEQVQLLFQEQRIGAQRDEFLALDDAFDDLADLLVDQRLAARNGDHRRAALVDGVEAFLHRQALIEDGVGIVDLAAADAGEVAAKQRLQHQHQRIAFAAFQALPHDVGTNSRHLA